MNSPFIWDHNSDQPYPIKDRVYKKTMRKKYVGDYLKLFFTNLIFFPLSIIVMKFFKKKQLIDKSFYGIGVNLDKGDTQQALVEELGVKSLLIRLPLSDMENIDAYVEFAKSFGSDKEIVINLLQDREHIDNPRLLAQDIEIIFTKFHDITLEYQVGNAINRTKWGFFAMQEYLEFFTTIQTIRDETFPTITLIAPSIIDFEYYYTIRTLFNNYNLTYDKSSALLYVDRRGSPYNTQMGIFDTKNKINMLYALIRLSPKTKSDALYITEVNWPLINTAPYAPTSEYECVDEESYSQYMLEYFDIAAQSGKVDKVFWHQLVANGYGLVDTRNGELRKREAFYKFRDSVASVQS